MKNFDVFNIDGRLLNIFLSLCETSSVSQTANRFGVTQSTISHSLDKLRNCIEDPLFVKAGRGITPTPIALEIEPRVMSILSQIEGLRAQSSFEPSVETKPITIVSNVTEMLGELMAIHDAVAKAAPLAGLRFLEHGTGPGAAELLGDTAVDLVIMARTINYPSNLSYEPLFIDYPVVYYDPTMRGPVETLQDYEAARHGALDYGGVGKSLVARSLEKKSIQRDIRVSASNSYALSQLIKGTDVVATIQSRLGNSVFSEFDFSVLPFDICSFQYDMVWHKRSCHTGRNTWLRKLVKSVIA